MIFCFTRFDEYLPVSKICPTLIALEYALNIFAEVSFGQDECKIGF